MTKFSRGAGSRPNHLRLTFAYGSLSRTLALPRGLAFGLLGVLPFVALLYLAATCYFLFHDDLLVALTRHQVEMQYAYEDRVAGLRHDIETMSEEARAQEDDFTDRIRALSERQDQVENRTALVAALAQQVKQLRLPEPPSVARPQPDETIVPSSAPATADDGKPHPEGFDFRLRKDEGQDPNGANSTSAPVSPIGYDGDLPLPEQIHLLIDRYDRVDRQDLSILADLDQPPALISHHIRAALAAAGVDVDKLAPPPAPLPPAGRGLGGPLVPLPILSDGSAFAGAAGKLEAALTTLEKLRSVLPDVPLRAPLPGDPEITSGFGPRIDPFLGTPALHTGIDLLDDYGAPVRATAAGTVVTAGFDGGYGNMVEVDHGNGLSTRYAHLSSIDVVPGEKVKFGTVLGHIGATGRATGPHLHYEVRIDGEPVDPLHFLRAGAILAAADIATP